MAALALVPDASVLVKLWLVEEDSTKARYLRDRFTEGAVRFVVPTLAFVEVANAFRHSPQTRGLDVRQFLEDLYALGMERVEPDMTLVVEAYGEARRVGATVYDALYLTLAKRLDGVMVTSDARFDKLARSRHVATLDKVHAELSR